MSGSDLFGWDSRSCYSMENSSDHKIEEDILVEFEKTRKTSKELIEDNNEG